MSLKVISERQRRLADVRFQESTTLTRDLPRDTVLKFLQLRLSGSVVTTYASGTPVADAESIFDNLVSRIDIVVNGSRTVKNVRPHLMSMQQLMAAKINGERKASAAAAAAAGNNPTVDGGFVYGTTTQTTTVAESILIPFENIMAPGLGKEATWLNLKGVASAEIRFSTKAFSALRGFGNTAPVVYSADTFIIEIQTIEAQDVPSDKYFSDFKQTTKEEAFSSETTGRLIDINRGNLLQGIMMFAKDGAAGSATTATGKVASNLLITDLSLKINGQVDIKTTNFLALQAENKNKWGLNIPNLSNVSRFDGVAYLDMLRDGDITTALPCMPPDVDQVNLNMSTRSSSVVSYTNPAIVTLMTNEIVQAN